MSEPGPADLGTARLGGRLLVASPLLGDPNFERSVVLMLDHDGSGALGVILNRASEVAVADILPDWADVVAAPDVVFSGGPVSQDSALAVVGVGAGVRSPGVRPVAAELAVLDLDASPERVAPALRSMRVFAGYAGWSAGQLEGEVAEGAWFVVDAGPLDVFCADPADLWRRVLARQPPPLAWAATYPPDPTWN